MGSQITSVQKSQEVSALLSLPNCRIIAGGTTFTSDMYSMLHLIDISALDGLDGIRQQGQRIVIGPLVTHAALADSPLIREHIPALADCAALVTPDEIRERGTLGGSLAGQRIGDCAPVLMAVNAKLTIRTDCDFREVMADRFRANELASDEWICRVTIPLPGGPFPGEAYGKLGAWEEGAVTAAVRLCLDERGSVTKIRTGLSTGDGKLTRVFPIERRLKSKPGTPEAVEKAVEAAAYPAPVRELLHDILRKSLAMAAERRAS